MAAHTQRIAELERRVDDLAAKLELYHRQAAMVRSLEDIYRDTYSPWPQRPQRHLSVVGGGAP